MHRFYFQRLGLCEEAGETSPAPSGAAVPAETPAAAAPANPPTAPPADAPAAQAKVGLLDRARAIAAGAGGNAQTIANLQQQLVGVTAERDGLLTQIATAQGRLTLLENENTQLKAVAKSVEETLSAIGIPEASLPAQSPAAVATATAAEVAAQADAETDPRKKGDLARQSLSLMKTEATKN